MIIVRMIGGLGNQMFQYAMARSLADHHNANLKLDLSDFEHYTLRRYELQDFNVRAEIAGREDLDSLKVRLRSYTLWQRMKRRILPDSPMVFRERSFAYNKEVHRIRPPVYLDGYWQSERYFASNIAVIRKDFTLNVPLDPSNTEMMAFIGSVNAVSLHVRRGDYIEDPNTNRFHGVCPIGYYNDAVTYISCRVGQIHLFVFSDDYEWASHNLIFDHPTTFVTLNSNTRGIFDMMLMRQCKHHVVANSSFSWWGAWLNPSESKIVVAPQKWFRDGSQDTCDLVPARWVLI